MTQTLRDVRRSEERDRQLSAALHVLECFNEQSGCGLSRIRNDAVSIYIVRDGDMKAAFDKLVESQPRGHSDGLIPRI